MGNFNVSDRYYSNPYENRIDQLDEVRHRFCGLDTRQVKLLLNKLAETDHIAAAYRYALEAEDSNIKAKKYRGTYRDDYYDKKDECISMLSVLCDEYGWDYGKQTSDLINIPWVVYFDLPDCEQISFHTKSDLSDYPDYKKPWDGKEDSTLPKIEDAITRHFEKELKERKEYLDLTKDKRAAAAKKRAEKKAEEERRKEEEAKKRQAQLEQERIARRADAYSTKKMIERYDEFVESLSQHADKYVRVKYCSDGVFANFNSPEKRFNLFVWGNEGIYFSNRASAPNTKYYDGYVLARNVINFETKDSVVIKDMLDKINAEIAAREREKKDLAKQKRHEKNVDETLQIRPWLEKNPDWSKTLYKKVIAQIKKSGHNDHIAVILKDDGLFKRKYKKGKFFSFNPVIENSQICYWKPEYEGTYTKVSVCGIRSNVDNSTVRC